MPDGAADVSTAPGDKTPLEEANLPRINELARRGRIGLVRTIPRGVPAGSEAGNMAILGYDPVKDLTGRSPLEAVSMGIRLGSRDIAFRANLVTLEGNHDGDYELLTIVDHASGDISNEEANILIADIDKALGSGDPANEGRVRFYPGISYRHAFIVRDGAPTENGIGDVYEEYQSYNLVPPHDILGRQIGLYLPDSDPERENERYLLDLMMKSHELLKDHPVNKARAARGERQANSLWLWGEGRRPTVKKILDRYGVSGAVISAVDLIKGVGICAGLEPITVEGATGTVHTNYQGKAQAAIDAFAGGKDFVYIHVEGPDESSHQGSRADKIESLERIDSEIVGPVIDYLHSAGEPFRVLIVPDHRTPVIIRTHTDEPVPFVLYDSEMADALDNENYAFSERAGGLGVPIHSGRALADAFFLGPSL